MGRSNAMLDHEIPTGRKPASTIESEELPAFSSHLVTTTGDVIPFAPNLIATIVSFGFLVIAPWLVGWGIDWIIGEDTALDDVGPGFLMIVTAVTILVAFGTAMLFLVIGMILQFWQYHKPFGSWWPVALALPVAWGLLLPEVLVRGGSVLYWAALGAAIAVAFCVHWLALVVAREALE
jgi:hypothetical protein